MKHIPKLSSIPAIYPIPFCFKLIQMAYFFTCDTTSRDQLKSQLSECSGKFIENDLRFNCEASIFPMLVTSWYELHCTLFTT